MEDILARLGYTLEKKLNVGEDLNVWDKVISYLSDIIGLRKHVNPSNIGYGTKSECAKHKGRC